MEAVDTLVTTLTFVRVTTVDAVLRFLYPVAVITVFTVATFADEVTVFTVGDRFAVVAVFIRDGGDPQLRGRMHQLIKLLKK